MERFYFIQNPEQIFNLKQRIDGAIPVLPVFDDLNDFNRIASSVKRWGWLCAVFYERTAYPLKQFLTHADKFDYIFTMDSDTAKALRETGYKGGICLFSNFRMLVHEGFFKEFNITPVVSGKANYDLAKANNLEAVYLVSDKICVADFGLCISRKSTPQSPFNCDNRCREKSKTKAGLDCPLSMRPDFTAPEKNSYLCFTERPFFPDIKSGVLRDQTYEKSWNYRYPIGIEILKPGKTGNGKNFIFPLDKKTEKLFDKGLIEFYGYTNSMYKGHWINSAKVKKSDDSKVSVAISDSYQSVLMVHRYTEEERDFLKKARHFIYTLPESKLIEVPENEDGQITVSSDKPVRKYSGRAKLTLVSDDPKKFSAFKGRDVEKRVLQYKRGVNKGFSDYLYVAGTVNPQDFDEISMIRKLKGIVVPDGVMREAFQRLFPDKDIILHPLAYFDSKNSPSYISASTTIFVSRYKSEKRNNYGWPDLNIFLKNQNGFMEFVSKKKLSRSGGRKELWVNITDITDEALQYLKSQAETILRKVK